MSIIFGAAWLLIVLSCLVLVGEDHPNEPS